MNEKEKLLVNNRSYLCMDVFRLQKFRSFWFIIITTEKKAKLKEIHWNVRIRKTNYNEIILQFERRKKTVLSVRDIIRRTN
jgi:hypothetical protein